MSDTKINKVLVPSFVINYPNKHKIFDKHSNKVKGQAEIYFHRPCSGVTSIELGFKGDLREHLPVVVVKKGKSVHRKTSLNTKIGILFNDSHTVFPENPNGGESVSVAEDTVLKFPVDFEFPAKEHDLPTSCNSWRQLVTVRYELYLRLSFKDRLGKISYTDFLCPLKFQGGSLQEVQEKRPSLPGRYVFENKRILFEPDANGNMTPTINKPSKGLSKFMKKGKSKTKDVDLSLNLDLNPNINMLSRVFDTPITIKCLSKLKPELLQHNGKSTKLGYFEIESMQLVLKVVEYSREIIIFDEKFQIKPAFDLKDFQNGSITTTINELNPENPHKNETFMDILQKPVITQNSLSKHLAPKFAIQAKLKIGMGEPSPVPSSTSNSVYESALFLSSITNVNFYVAAPKEAPSYETQANYYSNVDEFSADSFHYTRVFSPSETELAVGTGGGIGVTRDDYLGPDTKGEVTTTILFTGKGTGSCSYYQPGCYDCGDGYDTTKYHDGDDLFSGLGDEDYDQFASLGWAVGLGGGTGGML
ncbi:unnamed protein product [Ambrosiozyma monospora]|uniref:Unnamed protein product n=1 Tax=Ambrosiozyma monospora TaxID=43982 RepID=A0ACB5SY09_AMBMO|nr:unnamed protein product [Ambrosiozyma monospora]